MWLSGANFGLLYVALAKRSLRAFWDDTEFKVYTAITLIAAACITAVLVLARFGGWGFWTSLRVAVFQVPTILTTTGYATSDFNLWPIAAVIFLVVLMFIGGSTGSTGGGLKVLRHVINVKLIYHEVRRVVRPSLVTSVRVAGRVIESSVVNSVAALTILYLFLFGIGTLVLCLTGVDLVSAFTASIANLGNIGPGLNVVGPASNYGSLSTTALWTLTALMLLGRLEIYTVFVLLLPSTWKK
jgi:trk system potassium uptake protein TrkH